MLTEISSVYTSYTMKYRMLEWNIESEHKHYGIELRDIFLAKTYISIYIWCIYFIFTYKGRWNIAKQA